MSDLTDGCIEAATDIPDRHRGARDRIAHDAVVSPNSLTATDVRILGRGYADLAAEITRLTARIDKSNKILDGANDDLWNGVTAEDVLGSIRAALED